MKRHRGLLPKPLSIDFETRSIYPLHVNGGADMVYSDGDEVVFVAWKTEGGDPVEVDRQMDVYRLGARYHGNG